MKASQRSLRDLKVVIDGRRQPLELDVMPLGQGGEASIFRATSTPGLVAKIYHPHALARHASRAKLLAMLASPPQSLSILALGQEWPQFAWPTHLVENDTGAFDGFLMPEIPLDQVASLSKYMARTLAQRSLSLDDQSLPRRIAVCRNLAAAIAEIHRQEHFFVDIKPQNIYMFRDTGIVCLLDNDSFSIAGEPGAARFPATAFSSQYLAPELLRSASTPASIIDDTQDRFAMAVLMFQILNHGRHPFQGQPLQTVDEWNDDLCVKQNYYAYGLTPHPAIAPSPASIHDCLDLETRKLFDSAFTAAPADRPSAAQWRDHLEALQERKDSFVRCHQRPDDVRHLHLSGMSCPECRLNSIEASQANLGANSGAASITSPIAGPASAWQATPVSVPAWQSRYWLAAAIVALVIGLLSLQSRLRGAGDPHENGDTLAHLEPSQSARAPTPYDISAASAMSSADDPEASNARRLILTRSIQRAAESNHDGFLAVLKQALVGNDAQTLALAQEQMRDMPLLTQFANWQRFRYEARAINAEQIGEYQLNLLRAVSQQSIALILDPLDREIAGNLAYYMALNGALDDAFRTVLYAMSLPRPAGSSARSVDWQLVGAVLALQGRLEESEGALQVALAVTPRLSGLCKSLLSIQAEFGEELKAPIESVFRRIAQRGRSEADGCSWPPAWSN